MRGRIGLLIWLCFAFPAQAATVNLYVHAGQSNSLGTVLPYSQAIADFSVRLYPELGGIDQQEEDFTNMEAPPGNDPALPRYLQIVQRDPMNLAPVTLGGYPVSGPEIAFGRSIYVKYGATHNTVIAKFSIGGSSLERHWINSTGVNLADRMIVFLAQIRSQMEAAGDTVVVSGFSWIQGEADSASQKEADKYLVNLRALANKMKNFSGNLNLPITVARTSVDLTMLTAAQRLQRTQPLATVRAAQERFVETYNCSMLVNLDDLPHRDAFHFQIPTYPTIGQREFSGIVNAANKTG